MSENPKSYERPQPFEEDEEVMIMEDPEQKLRIGTNLNLEVKEKLINILRDYKMYLSTLHLTCRGSTLIFLVMSSTSEKGFAPSNKSLGIKGLKDTRLRLRKSRSC